MDLRKLTIPFFAILLLGLGNIQSGKEKAETCIACLGEDGNSVVGLWPSLAGQNTNYLKKQLRLIQSGERPIPVMNGQLDGYDDQDLEDMAAYYASKKNKIGEASADLVEQGFVTLLEAEATVQQDIHS